MKQIILTVLLLQNFLIALDQNDLLTDIKELNSSNFYKSTKAFLDYSIDSCDITYINDFSKNHTFTQFSKINIIAKPNEKYKIVCYGPMKNGLKQPLFSTGILKSVVGKNILTSDSFKSINPKKVIINLIGISLKNGEYLLTFMDRKKKLFKVHNNSIELIVYDDNPPISIKIDDDKSAILKYDMLSFSLFPIRDVKVSLISDNPMYK